MIILDTNVISELMRPAPNPAVIAWIAVQPRSALFTTSVSQAEVFYGIAALPKGRRRDNLAAAAEAMFSQDLEGRVMPFASAAARHYAVIVAVRRQTGNPIEAFDAMIAGTALAAGAGLATRDIGGFQDCGLAELINPWDAS
jgi:predicted nucleic acid-binding protein